MSSQDVVLNLGCGIGPQAITYERQYKKMIGVDIGIEKLTYARGVAKHYNIPLYLCCCDVEQLPFPKSVFDTVMAIDVIEHVLNPATLLTETYRVLKPTGHLLITFPCLIDKWKRTLFWMKRQRRQFQQIGLVNIALRMLRGTARKVLFTLLRKRDKIGRQGREDVTPEPFNPDSHKHNRKPREWLRMIASSGFEVTKSRSTSLFPPLHALGVAKFWFTNHFIFKVDSLLSSQRFIKNLGQSMVCVAQKRGS